MCTQHPMRRQAHWLISSCRRSTTLSSEPGTAGGPGVRTRFPISGQFVGQVRSKWANGSEHGAYKASYPDGHLFSGLIDPKDGEKLSLPGRVQVAGMIVSTKSGPMPSVSQALPLRNSKYLNNNGIHVFRWVFQSPQGTIAWWSGPIGTLNVLHSRLRENQHA